MSTLLDAYERLKRNYEAPEAFEELRKAGQKHRGGNPR